MTTEASADATGLLRDDHRGFEQLFRHLEAACAVGAVENQRDLAQRLLRQLSVHAAVEEQGLYPAARDLLSNGDGLADHSLDAHGEVKRALAKLERRAPGGEGCEECVARVASLGTGTGTGTGRAQEEEGELFPELRRRVGQERLRELGTAVERARQVAPTRPHPYAPANIVVGAVAAVADQARDVVRDLVHDVRQS